MDMLVLIEEVPGSGFRATGGFALTAAGSTRDEAFQKLQGQIRDRMAAGAEVVPLRLPAPEHPWLQFAGMFRDDPLFEEWQEAIAERRRQVDADPDVP
jgi:hypothetical protein